MALFAWVFHNCLLTTILAPPLYVSTCDVFAPLEVLVISYKGKLQDLQELIGVLASFSKIPCYPPSTLLIIAL